MSPRKCSVGIGVIVLAILCVCSNTFAEEWAPAPGLNVPRQLFGAAVDDSGNIWVLGGWNRTSGCSTGDGPVLDSVEILRFGGISYAEEWDLTEIVMPTPRTGHSVVITGGFIYVLGGVDQPDLESVLSQVDRYDIQSDTWDSGAVPPLNEPTFEGAAVTDPLGRIWYVGGRSAVGWESVVATVQIFDPAQPELRWQPGPSLNQPRTGFACVLDLEGRIHAIDGVTLDGVHIPPPTVARIDPCSSNPWTVLPQSSPGPATFRADGVLGADGYIYVVGGWVPNHRIDRVVRLDPEIVAWETWSPVATARDGHRVVLGHDDHIYAIGGDVSACMSTTSVERLYTGSRVFSDCNGNGVIDEAETRCNASADCNTDDIPDECQGLVSSTLAADVIGVELSTKNRFLSFATGDPGAVQGVRVTFDALPPPFDLWNGAELWVGAPSQVSEVSSEVEPSEGSTFTAARLQCEPFYTDWSAFDMLHVFHEGIVPGGMYSIQVINELCDATVEAGFSPALTLHTAIHGDTVLDLGDEPPLPPNGPPVDIVDALAILEAFSNVPGAIIKPRADLEPGCLDLKINVSDVLASLAGFSGVPYAFTPTAADPCESTCVNPLP